MLVSDNCIIRQCYNEYILIVNFGHKNRAFDIKTLLSKTKIFKNIVQTKKWWNIFAIVKQGIYDQSNQEIYAYIEI